MQFRVATIIALAASVMAAPYEERAAHSPITSDVTIEQATNQCGNGQQLQCCNKNLGSAGSGNGGLVGGILNGLTVVDECSSLSVSALIGVSDLLKDHCSQTVVCCNADGGSTEQNGLINVAAPIQCLSLNGLL